MEFIIKQNSEWGKTKTECLVVPVFEQKNLSDELKAIDAHCDGLISKLHKSGDIRQAAGSTTLLHNAGSANMPRILLVGCGKSLNLSSFRNAMKTVHKEISSGSITSAHLLLDAFAAKDLSTRQRLQHAASVIEGQTYKYDTTLSKKTPKSKLEKIVFFCDDVNADNKKAVAEGKAMANGMNIAKQLGNLPANICTPTFLANEAKTIAKKHSKFSLKVLSETEMKKLKMGSLLSVTAGTEEPAKFIIMEYKGGKTGDKPYVLVGKGVTFDTGGISLKPGPKMDEMKYDMCGAASVLGTLNAIAELDVKLNVIGVIAAVENMPSGKATKPGDVVTSMSGQTIEVLNTDAEGRLILCDALTYVERYKPEAVIDIATLTGACIVALGKHASGLYSNQDALSQQLLAAGEATFDRAWAMPLWEEFDKQLSSRYADIANIGGPEGGSVTAACFLARFTKKYHWAHLDIAGSAWDSGGEKGATGRPVSLLTQYLLDRC